MKKENALKVVIVSLVCPVLYFGLQILTIFVYGIVYGAIHSAEKEADYDAFAEKANASLAANSILLTLVAIVIFFAVIFIFFKVRHKNLLERVQWNAVAFPVYGLVAVAAVTSLLSVGLLSYIVLPDNVLGEVTNYSETVASGGILLTIIVAVLFGPIGEELVFRGFMMVRLWMRFPAWFAVASSALLFSVVHAAGGIGQIMGTAWTGVFFCLVFLWTKNLRISILAHIVNNTASLFLIPDAIFTETSMPVKLILFVVCLAVTVFLMRLIYRRGNTARHPEQSEERSTK